jgi:hypothetical protein
MSFFKKYNGSTHVWLVRMEAAIWVLIYGGLLVAVLGAFAQGTQGQDATWLYWVGGTVVALGVLLVYLRSRLHDES